MTSHTITGTYPAGYNVTAATLFNQGTISGPLLSEGVGLYSKNSADITNSGVIAPGSLRTAVSLHAGGVLTNQSGGTIGGAFGVVISGGAGTVVNAGRISAAASNGVGIDLAATSVGTITNAASGSIAGAVGIDLLAGGTVTNAGTIFGSGGTAVAFGGTGSNLLVLDPGAVFSGVVAGSASAANTLELTSAATAGTLAGPGGEFTNFGSIVLDAGAAWTLGGTVTAGQTIRLAGTSDTLSLDNPGSVSGTIYGFNDCDSIIFPSEVWGDLLAPVWGANNVLTLDMPWWVVGEAGFTLRFDPSQNFSYESLELVTEVGGTTLTMAGQLHWSGGSGNFNTAADWRPNFVPDSGDDVTIAAPGSYTVTATTDETVNTLAVAANATLVVSAGTFTLSTNGGVNWQAGSLAGSTIVRAGAVLAVTGGEVDNSGTVTIAGQVGAGAFALSNEGTVNVDGTAAVTINLNYFLENVAAGLIEATGAGGLTIASGAVDNAGTMLAASGSTLTFQSGVVNTDNTGGVLSGGTWEASGNGSTLSVTGSAVTVDRAAIILSGAGSVFSAGAGNSFTNLEASLRLIAPIGTLQLLAERSFAATNGIADFGIIQLAGGTLTLPRLAVGTGGHVSGFGTIADTRLAIFDGGTIEANGGTLAIASAVDPASSGVFQLDASSLLDIAADQGAADKMNFLGTSELIIDDAADFGLNVGSAAYTGPLIENFGTGDQILLKNVAPAGLTPVYDTTTGILQLSNGSANAASLMFDKATLGTGSFHLDGDGHGHALLTHS